MINKRIVNIVCAVALLGPVMSQAANNPSTDSSAQSQASAEKSELMMVDVTDTSNVGSKVRVKRDPKPGGQPFDNYGWIPSDWYEGY